ncbi:MAG: phosphatase PAP2 family protein [Clostridiales bacterium]|jgi:undecaprenyl-diphosphatase|nr:phosphatase PAP2 family protein [Clostridiales bacterium]
MTEIFTSLNEFELGILRWIQEVFQSAFLDTAMPYITKLGDGALVYVVCVIVLLCFKKTRKIGVAIGIAMLLELLVVNVAMKPLFARTRPYDASEVGLLIEKPSDYSFPSGHTAGFFAFAVTVLLFDKRFGIPAVVIACFVALSRLYLFVHYPTDVLAGLIIGILIAFAAKYITLKIWKEKRV